MADKQLYFLAVVPPEPLLQLLWEFKNQVAKKFDSKAALRSPPHITLHMPFKMTDKKREIFITKLTKQIHRQQPFRLELDGFGAFPPKVVFIRVTDNPILTKLQKTVRVFMTRKMSIHNANYRNKPFKPHLTIAFRDLKSSQFRNAWEYYQDQSFKSACLIDQIVLLKHDGKQWEPDVCFRFGANIGL